MEAHRKWLSRLQPSGCTLKLFINYRREDTEDFAGRLHDHLVGEFGKDNIFKDVDSIRPGDNWKVALEQSVGQCDVVLALIGDRWAQCKDETGKARIQSDNDWVRFELEAAYRTNRIVMPVLVKGTRPIQNKDLPESLHWLTDANMTEIRGGAFFKDDVARLISELRSRRDRLTEQKKAANVTYGQPVMGAVGIPDGQAGTTICPTCRRTCNRSDKFCDGCGSSLWMNCPKCVAPVLVGQRFCKACGGDVILFAQATAQREEHYRRFTTLTSQTDAALQLRDVESLIRDIGSAQTAYPFFTPLAELRQQIVSTIGEAAKTAAAKAFLAKNYTRALQLYQRLDELGWSTSEGTARLGEMQATRRAHEEKSAELANKGDIRKAQATLTELLAFFPEDPTINGKIKSFGDTLDRVKQLTDTGIRGMLSQHKLVQLDREITWLQSTRMNIQKLPDIATTVRKKLAEANNAMAQAHTEMTSGNVRKAQNIAMEVLSIVADHEEAKALVRQSGEIVDKVAQLQALVQERQWCAARHLEREIEAEKVNDPRLPKLAALIKSGISVVDNQIILLGTMIVLMLLTAFFGIPYLTTSLMSFPPLPTGYYLAAGAAILALIIITWTVFRSKSQTIQRLLMVLPRSRSKPSRLANAEVPHLQPLNIPTGEQPTLSTTTATIKTASAPPEQTKPVDLSTTPTLAPIMARVASPVPMAENLSATELDQRLENTSISVEWLVIGMFSLLLGYSAASYLAGKVNTTCLQLPIFFLVQIIPVYLAFLMMNRLSRWLWPLVTMAGSSLLLILIGYVFVSPLVHVISSYLGIWIVTGLMTAYLLRCKLWTGLAAATAGPLIATMLASPFLFALLFGINFAVPLKEGTVWGNMTIPLLSSAMIWALLSIVMSSPSGTLIRFIAAENQVVRGVFALALALIVSCIAYCAVALFTLVLSEKSLWIMAWILLFAVCQFTTALMRGQWSKSTSLISAGLSFVLLLILALFEKFSPGVSSAVLMWGISATSVILLRSRTLDAFRHDSDFNARLRTRLKSYRLPFRLEVRRVS